MNESFYATANNIYDFDMTIFNRWGQKIFYTTSLTESWNGKFKGEDSHIGVYSYIIFYKINNNSKKNIILRVQRPS
jgi:gliding motility-associated-like protein